MSLEYLKKNIKNWKLVEVLDCVTVIAENSVTRRNELLDELNLPQSNDLTGMNREETNIDWPKMPEYYKFFLDEPGWKNRIMDFFLSSELAKSKNVIITYGWKEPMVKVPTNLFIEDWEGFIRSTFWETIIFSEDYKLIIEVSRNYCLHSNFRIVPKEFEEYLDCNKPREAIVIYRSE